MLKNKKKIDGEYDPPMPIVKNPTKEQIEAANKLIAKYERMAAERKKNR